MLDGVNGDKLGDEKLSYGWRLVGAARADCSSDRHRPQISIKLEPVKVKIRGQKRTLRFSRTILPAPLATANKASTCFRDL